MLHFSRTAGLEGTQLPAAPTLTEEPRQYIDPITNKSIAEIERSTRPDHPEFAIGNFHTFQGKIIVIFGGTFDMFHYAHLIAAYDVVADISKRYQVPREDIAAVFMPAHRNPEKENAPRAGDTERYNFIVDALRSHAGFYASNFELNPEIAQIWEQGRRPSYTLNTVELLSLFTAPRNVQLMWVVGSEYVETFHKWDDNQDLMRKATIVFATRPGHEGCFQFAGPHHAELALTDPEHSLERRAEILKLQPWQVEQFDKNIVHIPALDISSTMLRNVLRQQNSLLVPKSVLNQIPAAVLRFALKDRPEVYVGRSFKELFDNTCAQIGSFREYDPLEIFKVLGS